MAKLNKQTRELILTEVELRQSTKNGGHFWEITWRDPHTGERFKTCLQDRVYKNFQRNDWSKIIDNDSPWGLYKNVKTFTDEQGRMIADADSKPELIEPLMTEDDVRMIVKHLNSLPTTKTVVKIENELFDWPV